LTSTIETKDSQLIKLTQQKNKLHDFLEQGIYSTNTFLERMNTLSSRINSINKDIENLHTKISSLNEGENSKKNIIPWIDKTIESIENIYWKLDVKQRNEFLKSIIDQVTYNKNKNADRDDFELTVYLKRFV